MSLLRQLPRLASASFAILAAALNTYASVLTLDAVPSAGQTLAASRAPDSLELPSVIDVDQTGLALTLEFGGLSTTGGTSVTLTDGTVVTGDAFPLVFQVSTSGMTISFALIGDGGITKTGPGTLTLSGASANTRTGNFTVEAGTLVLDKSDGVIAVADNLVIGDLQDTDTVRLESNEQIADTATVTLQGGAVGSLADIARLNLGGATIGVDPSRVETFAMLSTSGSAVLDFSGGTVTSPTFLYLDALALSPGSRLTVENWIEFTDYFLVKRTALDTPAEQAQLARIVFAGTPLTSTWKDYNDDYYQIVPDNRQTITFPAIADPTDGDAPLVLGATASSGLPVYYEIISGFVSWNDDDDGDEEASDHWLRLDYPGEVTLRALQSGNEVYPAAEPVELTFTIRPGPRPENDDFADAGVLSGESGSLEASNRFATSEPGEPWGLSENSPNRTVWWRWTAPANGRASFDGYGSDFYAILHLYEGTDLPSLTEIGFWSDDWESSGGAVIPVTAGTVYHIRMSGFDSRFGDLRLNWNFFTTPVPRPATRITNQGCMLSWQGNARAYRLEILDPESLEEWRPVPLFVVSLSDVTSHVLRGLSADTTYAFRIVATGEHGFEATSETLHFTTLPASATPPPNDFVAAAIELEPSGGRLTASNRGATNEAFETTTPLASVWYRWTPAAAGLWRLRLSAPFPATLTLFPAIDSEQATAFATAQNGAALDWETRADASYLVRVSGQDAAQGTFTLSWELVTPGAIPANDAFAGAIPFPPPTGLSSSVTGANRLASVEAGEPAPGIASLWWRWTATRDEIVSLGKTSDFDCRLRVYEGSALDHLHLLFASDHLGDDSPRFEAEAGVTYYFRVDGRNPSPHGTVRLTLRFTPHPVLAPATAITETGFTIAWTGTDSPCMLEIYDYARSRQREQRIELPAGQHSHTFSALRPGTTYSYTVTSLGIAEATSAVGTATTRPATEPVPANDSFAQATVLGSAGGSLTTSNRYASNETREAEYLELSSAGRSSLWFKWTPSTTGEWRFSLAGSAVPAGIALYSGDPYFWDLRLVGEATGTPAEGAACLVVAEAGRTYHIALLGVGGTRGDLALTWNFVQPLSPPDNDDFADAETLEGASGAVPVTLDLASGEWADSYSDGPNVWYRWQAPASGRARLSLNSAREDTSLMVHAGDHLSDLEVLAWDDGYYNPDGVLFCEWNAHAGVIYSIRVQGRDRLGPDATLTWDQLDPLTPDAVVVTRGPRFFTLRPPPLPVASPGYFRLIVSTQPNLSDPVHDQPLITGGVDYAVTGLRPSTRYYYQISAPLMYGLSFDPIGTVDTTADAAPTPANDFAHPTLLPPAGGSVKGTTLNAVAGPVASETFFSGPKVWYAFTPATDGLWKVRVTAPAFSPRFELFQLTDPLSVLLASDHDPATGGSYPPAETVERTLPLRAGVRYLIAVGGTPGRQGAFTLALSLVSPLTAPANDELASAIEIGSRSGSVSCDLQLARFEEPDNPYENPKRVLWWRWTAPSDGRVLFTLTSPTLFNAYLYAGGEAEYGFGYEVSLVVDAIAGHNYVVRAGSRDALPGTATLSWGPTLGSRHQSIDFPELTDPAPGQSTIRLAATASSGLPVTYEVFSGPATVEGDILHLDGPGLVRIGALQAGDDFYQPARSTQFYHVKIDSSVSRSQTIHFPWPGDRYVGSAPGLLLATASSGLPVQFEIVSGPASVSGNALSVTGPGKVVVRALQPGDTTFPAATPVQHTFTVFRAPTAPVSLGRTARVYDGHPQTVLADTVPAGLHVAYAYRLGKGAPTSTPPTDAGTYTVTATLDDPSATAPASATSTLVIAKAPLVATGPALSRVVGQPNPALLGITYSGFFGTDTVADLDREPVASSKASAKSPAGLYPITLSGAADNNYSFSYVPGTLHVLGFDGAYEALLLDADAVALGKLELTLPANSLAFTGTLTLAGELKPIPLRGTLASTDGLSASGSWRRVADGMAELELNLRLSGNTFDGTLRRNGEDFLAIPTRGGARLLPARTTKLAWAGAHTFILRDPIALDPEDVRPLPLGGSHATAVIEPSGLLSLKGKLADGTPLTTSAKLDVAHRYRLFVKPYVKRLDSFLSGPLALVPHPDQTRFPGRAYVPEGGALLAWCKTALPETTKPSAQDPTCRAGFALDVLACLDPWLPPAAAKKATKTSPALPAVSLALRLGLSADDTGAAPFGISYDPNVDLGESQDADALPTAAILSAENRVTTGENDRQWTLIVTPATGAFSGSFVLYDQIAPSPAKPAARKVTFSGTLRQTPDDDLAIGYGYFHLPPLPNGETEETLSGEIRLLFPLLEL